MVFMCLMILVWGGAAFAVSEDLQVPGFLDVKGAATLEVSLRLTQTTADYTIDWADPAAARTLSIADPGGNDSFSFLAATETLTNKTLSTGSTWQGNAVGALYGGTGIDSSASTGFAQLSTGTWTVGTISETKGAAFLYPYANYSAYIQIPYNVTITAVRVYCEGGTNVTGLVTNNGAQVYAAGVTATTNSWTSQTASLTNTAYTAGNTIRLYISAVTDAVTGATVVIDYTRNP
jgi:hypothetical protein